MKKITLLFFLLLSAGYLSAQEGNQYESAIADFEDADKENLAKHKYNDWIVFTGSSSFRLWKDLESSFPQKHVVNRGFGGAQFSDLILYVKRIVLPYKPIQVVLYCGDNDLAAKTPDVVFKDFKIVYNMIRKELPNTQITFVSIKPSPKRANILAAQKKTNKMIQDFISKQKKSEYVDIYTPMLHNGKPLGALFGPDSLHMSKAGYDLWIQKIGPRLK